MACYVNGDMLQLHLVNVINDDDHDHDQQTRSDVPLQPVPTHVRRVKSARFCRCSKSLRATLRRQKENGVAAATTLRDNFGHLRWFVCHPYNLF